MLVGSSIVLLSSSFHLISRRWVISLMCGVMIGGVTQMAVRRYKR